MLKSTTAFTRCTGDAAPLTLAIQDISTISSLTIETVLPNQKQLTLRLRRPLYSARSCNHVCSAAEGWQGKERKAPAQHTHPQQCRTPSLPQERCLPALAARGQRPHRTSHPHHANPVYTVTGGPRPRKRCVHGQWQSTNWGSPAACKRIPTRGCCLGQLWQRITPFPRATGVKLCRLTQVIPLMTTLLHVPAKSQIKSQNATLHTIYRSRHTPSPKRNFLRHMPLPPHPTLVHNTCS